MTTRQIAFDTETTGLQVGEGHRIIEIGAVEIINRRLTGKHLHYYINPERDIDAGALAIHGITQDFLKDKPLFKDIQASLIDFIRDAEIIIHNASFDTAFLNHELLLLNSGLEKITAYCRITDSLALARARHPGQKNNLDALCKRYGIDNTKRDLHGALLDAQLLAHVYLAMTGGQGTLFEDDHAPHNTNAALPVTFSATKARLPLRVIKPSEEELSHHADYLAMLNQLSEAGCLWLQRDAEKAL